MNTELQCPRCGSTKLNKVGIAWSGQNPRQRYVCRDCHRVTIKPIIKEIAEAPTGFVGTPADVVVGKENYNAH